MEERATDRTLERHIKMWVWKKRLEERGGRSNQKINLEKFLLGIDQIFGDLEKSSSF
jgi:hypothetical protein